MVNFGHQSCAKNWRSYFFLKDDMFEEGRTGLSLARSTNLENRESWFSDIGTLFSQITKIRKQDTPFNDLFSH